MLLLHPINKAAFEELSWRKDAVFEKKANNIYSLYYN